VSNLTLKICKKDFALGVMGVFCVPMNEHETRSTPETLDKYWSAIAKCEQLERERDEAREELARMQTMAASVADIIAKRDAMLKAIREAHDALATALRQWVMYAEERDNEQLELAKHAEGQIYCAGQSTLAKLKPFLPLLP
jgi:iron-sulfur cluster repair protein YtfE (RIC family)